jgi:prepilin-type N-terminal cleavage/methylation domain-containing protein
MKKTNKKGFTLVELVVVSTIMVMIMGAILNWVRPMNKFYDRTQSLADSNDIGSVLMDYVDDELRYATNIVVLQNYQGVPQLNNQFLVSSSGTCPVTAKFTNALIIDNDAVRGSQLDGYDPEGTVAHRKRARGCILKTDISESNGIETDKIKILGSEGLYNDYGCRFDATLNTLENSSKCITIDMEITRPRREGANYVFDKFGFDQTRDFELVNVNIKNKQSPMKAWCYSFDDPNKDNYSGYDTFVQASAEGGPYTYILYTKKPVETKKVKVTLYAAKGSSQKIGSPITLNSGENLSEGQIKALWNSALASKYVDSTWQPNGTNSYKKRSLSQILSVETDENYENFKTTPIMNNLDLYCVIVPVYRDNPKNFIDFYDIFNEGGTKQSDYKLINHVGYWPVGSDEGADGIVTVNMDGLGDGVDVYKFVGWYKSPSDPGTRPSGNDDDASKAADKANGWFVSGLQYSPSDPDKYYAIYEEAPSILFYFEPAEEVGTIPYGTLKVRKDSKNTDLAKNTNIQNMTAKAEADCPTGKKFSHWEILDPDTSNSTSLGNLGQKELSELNHPSGAYFVRAVYKDNSHPGTYQVTLMIGADGVGWNSIFVQNKTWNGINPTFLLTNEDGNIIKQNEYGYLQEPNLIVNGNVYKIYISEGYSAEIGVHSGDANFTTDVSGDCTLSFDGTGDSLQVIG